MTTRFLFILAFFLSFTTNALLAQRTLVMPVNVDVFKGIEPEKTGFLGQQAPTINLGFFLGTGQRLDTLQRFYQNTLDNLIAATYTDTKAYRVLRHAELTEKEWDEYKNFINYAISRDGFTSKTMINKKKMTEANSAQQAPLANKLCDKYDCDRLLLTWVKGEHFDFFEKDSQTNTIYGTIMVYASAMDGDSGNIIKTTNFYKGHDGKYPKTKSYRMPVDKMNKTLLAKMQQVESKAKW